MDKQPSVQIAIRVSPQMLADIERVATELVKTCYANCLLPRQETRMRAHAVRKLLELGLMEWDKIVSDNPTQPNKPAPRKRRKT